MLGLRLLTFPVTLLAFSTLYSVSIKAPQTVEIIGLLLWMALPLVFIAKLMRRLI